MRVLILGGTVFLGRHLADEAVRRGHEVTLLHRGRHGADLHAGAVEHLIADRTGELGVLRDREWDAVVDTSGYEPEHVGRGARMLAERTAHYAFVSSCGVYPGWPREPVSEESAVFESDEREYGPLKAACERAVEAAMPGRVAHLRAGLICGPHDVVFRLPWWVERIARGGHVVAPGSPERSLQLVDARDLAAWTLDLVERCQAGTYNATAPVGQTTMAEVLDAARHATDSDARLHWIDDAALIAAGVEPWDEMPLWIPESEGRATWRVDTTRAYAAGLRCRPIADTVADVAAWLRAGAADSLPTWKTEARPRGLSPGREAELLARR